MAESLGLTHDGSQEARASQIAQLLGKQTAEMHANLRKAVPRADHLQTRGLTCLKMQLESGMLE
jgi:hypothetical protein